MSENPATALQSILRTIAHSEGTLSNAWHPILQVPVDSPEFGQRHSEIIGIWRDVNNMLLGLPPGDPEREQYLGYMPHYYDMLVHRPAWSVAANTVGDPMIVDQLTGLASTLRYRVLSSPTPTDESLARLRTSIGEWREILDEAAFDEKFSTELRGQVDHLEWLLDHIELFGFRPLVDASKKLAGSSVVAMATKPTLAKRIGKATAGFVAFVTLFNPVVDQATGMIDGLTELRDSVIELITPPKELETPKKPKELPAGPSALPSAPESPTSEAQE